MSAFLLGTPWNSAGEVRCPAMRIEWNCKVAVEAQEWLQKRLIV